MGRTKFKYTPPSAAVVRKHADASSSKWDAYLTDYPRYKVREGENLIRILPPTWEGDGHFGLEIQVYYSVGPDKQTYLVPKEGADPVQEERTKAIRQGDQQYADTLKKRTRMLYWVIDRSQESDGPSLWTAPQSFDSQLSGLLSDRDGTILEIDNPEKGFDVSFRVVGQGIHRRYESISIARSESPLSGDAGLMDEWLQFIVDNPLPDQLKYYSYEHIRRELTGSATSPGEEEEPMEDIEVGHQEDDAEDSSDRLRNFKEKYGRK